MDRGCGLGALFHPVRHSIARNFCLLGYRIIPTEILNKAAVQLGALGLDNNAVARLSFLADTF